MLSNQRALRKNNYNSYWMNNERNKAIRLESQRETFNTQDKAGVNLNNNNW